MTLLKATSTLLLALFTLVMEAPTIGVAVTEVVVRTISTTLTPMPCVLKTGD